MLMIVVDGINPEPWAVGTAYASRKGGKLRGGLSPNEKLQQYQQALKEEVQDILQGNMSEDGRVLQRIGGDISEYPNISLRFWFWRQIETGHSGTGREIAGYVSDATNLQKSTEDALQGLLFANDRVNRDVHSTIIAQGPDVTPCIVIRVKMFRNTSSPPDQEKADAEWAYSSMAVRALTASDNAWGG